ncbi:MAG: 4'-phosphopantetheinyl transferase superfamily protein [Cyclobacteriaceae bacterium]
MPLLLSKPISPYSAYAVWNIQEINDDLLLRIGEKTPQGMHPTRLAEWMVGRILVQNLCAQFDIKYRGMEPNEAGKPFLKGSTAQISISHSFPMAAAIINIHNPCGIDLERTREKLISIQDKFLHPSETSYRDNMDKLCAIWCGKEVLYKIHGRRKLSLKDEMIIEFEESDLMNGIILKQNFEGHYKIRFEKLKDYYLAYSF